MTNTKNQLETDIAVIKNTLTTIQRDIGDIKLCMGEADKRITTLESRQAGQEQRISNFAVFGAIFSVIIGAIATFLRI